MAIMVDGSFDLASMVGALRKHAPNGDKEPEIILREQQTLIARLARAPAQRSGAYRLHLTSRGAIGNLELQAQTSVPAVTA